VPRFSLSPALIRGLKHIAIAVCFGVLLVFSALLLFIATRDLGAIERDVVAKIEAETGARLSVKQSRKVYWPQPRVVMEQVQIDAAQHGIMITAPRLVIALNILDLLDGEIEEPTLILQDSDITINAPALNHQARSPRSITQILANAAALFEGRTQLTRLRIRIESSRLTLVNGLDGEGALVITPLDARMRYSRRTGRIDVFARRNADIRPLEFTFSLPTRPLLASASGAPASMAVSGYGSRASFNGRMRMDPDLSLIGEASGVFHPALAIALGLTEASSKAESREIANLSATLSLDQRGIGFEALRIAQGGKTLSGIAALRENGGRWGLSSTLAGDLVDGTAAHATLSRLREGEQTWSHKRFDINPIPKIDLDIRLSTRAFRFGGLDLSDVALSIFTRAGRAEFSIAEGNFGKGTIKARVSLMQRPEGNELRLLVSGDKLDVGPFLDRVFGFPRLNGKGSFVFQAESNGVSVADLVGNLAGSAAFDIRDGEITGVDLEKLAARSAALPPQAALYAAIGGRTPFEGLSASFTILKGRVEPAGSRFTSTNVESQIDGVIDLPGARHELAIILKRRRAVAGSESEFFAFRIEGPLMAPLLRPDMTLLPNRS
jgi:AsmA protein